MQGSNAKHPLTDKIDLILFRSYTPCARHSRCQRLLPPLDRGIGTTELSPDVRALGGDPESQEETSVPKRT